MLEVLSQSILIKYITKIISNTETAMTVLFTKERTQATPVKAEYSGLMIAWVKCETGTMMQ